jgi:LemA protein
MRNTIIIAVIAGLLCLAGCNSYNSMVSSSNTVNNAWAQVEGQYQRRGDLIDNLVATIKGASSFEQETLTKVIEARSAATQIKLDANDLSPEKMAEFEKAQENLKGSLSRLMVVSEQYPQLQSVQLFRDLSVAIEGCENRISIERKNYNNEVTNYNTSVQKFPGVLFAKIFNFQTRGLFKADPGKEKKPDVDFSKK